MSDKKEKNFAELLTGSRIVFLGLLIRSLLMFVCEIFLARTLGPTDYGYLTFSISLINLSSIVSGIGLNTASRRFIPIYIEHPERGSLSLFVKFSGIATLVASIGVMLLVIAASQVFSEKLVVSEWQLVLILSAAIPFWSLQKLFLGVVAGLKYSLLKVLVEDLFVPVGFLTSVFIAYYFELGVTAVVFGYVIVFGLSAVWVGIGVRRHPVIVASATQARSISKNEILIFSWPLVFTEVLGKATGLVEFLIISAVATATDLGLYRPASDLAVTMSVILMGFSFLYLPIVSEYFAKSETVKWQIFNARVARLTMFLSYPIFCMLFFYPEEVLLLFYGGQYVQSAGALRVLAVSYFIHAAVGFTGLNLIAGGYTRMQLLAKLCSVTSLIIATMVLMPRYGLLGAAYATLIGFVISNGMNMLGSFYYMKLHPFDFRYLRAATILVAVAYLLFALSGMVATDPRYQFFSFMGLVIIGIIPMFYSKMLFDREDRAAIAAMVKPKFRS